MTKKPNKLGVIDKVFVGLLLVVFGGIVLHAPLTIWLGTFMPGADLVIKSWKEILMAAATLAGGLIIWRRKRWDIIKNPIVLLIGGYALLHIALLPVFCSIARVCTGGATCRPALPAVLCVGICGY